MQNRLTNFAATSSKALYNAQLFEVYSREFDRNKTLLECIHELYEEQSSLETFVRCSLLKMKRLVEFEQVSMFLLDEEAQNVTQFSECFTLDKFDHFSTNEEPFLGSRKIALMVILSGEKFNYRAEENVLKLEEKRVRNILGKPIFDSSSRKIIGTVQFINKRSSDFSQNDEDILEAMIIFCTVGIANCRLYENLRKCNARAQVALEVLSYHNSASLADIEHLMNQDVPNFAELAIGLSEFDDFCLSAEQMVFVTAHILSELGIVSRFGISKPTLYHWIVTVMKNYRDIKYHNWGHAFNVFHTMYYLLHTVGLRSHFDDIDVLGIMVGCLCHDLDHRGTNNTFQIKTDSALAQLYGGQATLEHHHFNLTVLIINSEGNNILQTLDTVDLGRVMTVVRRTILSTDLSRHFERRQAFFETTKTKSDSWRSADQKDVLLSMLTTASDIAAATKRWPVAKKAAYLVMEEFFQQGDMEKSVYNMEPQYMMDRRKKNELPQMQIQWIDNVCRPLFSHLAIIDDRLDELHQQLLSNREQWSELDTELLETLNDEQ